MMHYRGGSQDQQQAAMLALGCCNSHSHEALLQELQPLTEEYMLERFKVRLAPQLWFTYHRVHLWSTD